MLIIHYSGRMKNKYKIYLIKENYQEYYDHFYLFKYKYFLEKTLNLKIKKKF